MGLFNIFVNCRDGVLLEDRDSFLLWSYCEGIRLGVDPQGDPVHLVQYIQQAIRSVQVQSGLLASKDSTLAPKYGCTLQYLL